ncbi:H-2 class II histocompatibility antigen, E-S beta chain-like isoform X2 [Myripristis murdjan]|uniref:H-2 class II histocompatibility antigen, E-S beta chain-like isoform X2 n=1 Tax=Myripristis murdjan TaxID=586833 RepID=UPI00117617F0|nr:H-2 class II histocompatibility antigen, E-S beta chain-like isoform X2 [Myripristis murdjan]
MASSFLGFSLLFLSLNAADGFMHSMVDRCEFNSTELQDMEFIKSYYFNKMELIRFSSSVGKFVGYTEFGVVNAERWNNDTAYLAAMRAEKERYCKYNAELFTHAVLSKKVKPSLVTLRLVTPPGGKNTRMLMCSVYSFYPKLISVKWLRDGKVTTSDVTTTDELANGDWYYQIHSQLEFTPRSGEKISCMVEHISLSDPLIKDWDPSLPDSEKNKLAIEASGPDLALILSLAEFIYCKKKVKGRDVALTN